MIEGNFSKIKLFVINFFVFFLMYLIISNLSSYMQLDVFANETQVKYKAESKLLNKYFNFKINKIISNEKHYYLVIKVDGCPGCASQSLSKIINLDFKDNVTLILSGNDEIDSNIINPKIKEIIYDKKGDFFKYNISPLNDCLIEVENQEITEIIQFGKVIENEKLKSALKSY